MDCISMNETTTSLPPTRFDRSEDFFSLYANNINFEHSAFDLRVVFGQIEHHGGAHIVQRAGIHLSWLEAKLAAIFFVSNVIIHEEAYGSTTIPADSRPAFVNEQEAALPLKELMAKIAREVAERLSGNTNVAAEGDGVKK
jgi:hypothetical protein